MQKALLLQQYSNMFLLNSLYCALGILNVIYESMDLFICQCICQQVIQCSRLKKMHLVTIKKR